VNSREASFRERVGREISAAGALAVAGASAGAVTSAAIVDSSAAAGIASLRTLGAASEKESTSTNSFPEPDGQLSRKQRPEANTFPAVCFHEGIVVKDGWNSLNPDGRNLLHSLLQLLATRLG
jgi:hypothetical protein